MCVTDFIHTVPGPDGMVSSKVKKMSKMSARNAHNSARICEGIGDKTQSNEMHRATKVSRGDEMSKSLKRSEISGKMEGNRLEKVSTRMVNNEVFA